jgi:hypothetical protein
MKPPRPTYQRLGSFAVSDVKMDSLRILTVGIGFRPTTGQSITNIITVVIWSSYRSHDISTHVPKIDDKRLGISTKLISRSVLCRSTTSWQYSAIMRAKICTLVLSGNDVHDRCVTEYRKPSVATYGTSHLTFVPKGRWYVL